MANRKTKTLTRDHARNYTLIGAGACLVAGLFVKVPLTIMSKPITDNVLLAVGALGMLIVFGVIQLVKAVRGGDPAPKP